MSDFGRDAVFCLQRYLRKSAGEGSRGGHVLGHTKSGKAIYARSGVRGDSMSQSHRYGKFTERDHRDAAEAHRQASVKDKGPPAKLADSASSKVLYDHDLASRLHDHIARTMTAGNGKSSEWHSKQANHHRNDQMSAERSAGDAKQRGDWKTHMTSRLWAQASSLAAQHHEKMTS